MGLDMEIRLVKKGYRIKKEYDFDDDDDIDEFNSNVKTLQSGNGRSEFSWLREWVANRGNDIYEFYGKFITIDENEAQELIDLALKNNEEFIYASYLPDIEYGSGKSIAILSLWCLYDRLGWEMQVECDW